MCRFTLYVGPPVRLATLLTEPSHSLIHQSFHARERKEPLNGDGFGMGWHAPRLTPEPACFRAITPAWNDVNLSSLAKIVTSPCVVAHVRAATQLTKGHRRAQRRPRCLDIPTGRSGNGPTPGTRA